MYKNATKVNRKQDDIIASQIDFGREKLKKDLDTLSKCFPKRLLNHKEAAEYLGVKPHTLETYVWSDRIKKAKESKPGKPFYRRYILDEYIERRTKNIKEKRRKLKKTEPITLTEKVDRVRQILKDLGYSKAHILYYDFGKNKKIQWEDLSKLLNVHGVSEKFVTTAKKMYDIGAK